MLVVIGALAAAVTTAIAYFIPWLPEQASTQREGIDFVFWLTTAICIGIFSIVAAVIVYAVFKFRAAPDDDSDGTPIHGHTGLEIVWTAVPTILVTIIAIASAIVVAQNEREGDDPLRIGVRARQFAWSFTYPNGVTSATLRLPVDRTAVLRLNADDVIHSFYVAEFGQKQDAVPGIETTLVITPKRVGQYPIACTELCGLGHSVMRSSAMVMEPTAYEAWAARQGQRVTGEDEEDAGAAVFEEQGCGSCHTFGPAGTQAQTGPPLDALDEDAKRHGREDAEAFVRESIVEPNALVHEGFQPNVMPHTYGRLPDEQIDALVQYLLEGRERESG